MMALVRGVFHHLQAVLLCNRQQRRHVGRQAGVVHRHDGLGARRDGGLHSPRADGQRGGVDVDQLHIGAQITHHLGGGGEGVRGGDDLVAGADAECLQGQVKPGGGAVDGDAVQALAACLVTQESGEVTFEPARLRAGGHPAAAQRVDDLGDLFFADFWQGERQERQRGQEGQLWRRG